MATMLAVVRTRFFDDQGRPLVGGKVYSYEVGTTTPKPTYSDPAATVPNTNPVILDDAGSADIYLSGTYTIRVEDADGVLIESADDVFDLSGLDSAQITTQQPHAGSVPRSQRDKNGDIISTKDFASPDAAALAAYNARTGLICFADTKLVVDQSMSPNLKSIMEWAQNVQAVDGAKFSVALSDGLHPVVANVQLDGLVNLTSVNTATVIQINSYAYTSLGGGLYSVSATLATALPAHVVVGYAIGVQCPQSTDKYALAAAGGHVVTSIAADRLSFTYSIRSVAGLTSPVTPLTNVTTYGLLANRLIVPSACIQADQAGWDGAAIEGFINVNRNGRLNVESIGISYTGVTGDRDIIFAQQDSTVDLFLDVVIAGAGECVIRASTGAKFNCFRAFLGCGVTGKEIWQGVHGCKAVFTRCMLSLGSVTGITATISSIATLSQCFITGGANAAMRTTYSSSFIELVTLTVAFCSVAATATRGTIGFGSNTAIHACPTVFSISAGVITGNPTVTDAAGAVQVPSTPRNVSLPQGGWWQNDLAQIADGRHAWVGTYSVVLNFSSIPSLGFEDLTVTATGVLFNDIINYTRSGATEPPQGIMYQAFVSAADQITLRAFNVSAAAIDKTAFTARFYVYRVS